MGAEEQREIDTQYLQQADSYVEVGDDMGNAKQLAFHTPEYIERVESAKEELDSQDPDQAEAHALSLMDISPEEEDVISQGNKEREAAAAAAAASQKSSGTEEKSKRSKKSSSGGPGTILEAAFVDPAYSWPPQDGQGKNAIELQASIDLLQGNDDMSVGTTESMKERMRVPLKPVFEKQQEQPKAKWWQCFRKKKPVDVEAVDQEKMREYEERKQAAKEARKAYSQLKRETKQAKEREIRHEQRYNRIPEGILIYQLDTSNRELKCLTEPHAKTDVSNTFLGSMIVEQAKAASNDPTRRGITVTGDDGKEVNLVACEQRTAIAWLEAFQIMLAKKDSKRGVAGLLSRKVGPYWVSRRRFLVDKKGKLIRSFFSTALRANLTGTKSK